MSAHDKIATRLSQIIIRLNNGERLKISDLADEFGVDKRTIQRDLVRLNALPIERENDLFFIADYALGKLGFKDIKNFAILSGLKGLYPSLDNAFITDILNEKLNNAYLIKNQNFGEIEISRREFDEISASIVKRWQISCVYNDKKRTLNPYKLINNNGIWYLLADDFGVLKNFTLSKLSEIKISQNEFSLNKEFLARIENNAQNWFSNTTFEVVLEIKSDAVPYFKRRKILPNYKIISDENTLKISTLVAYDDEILRVVKYWLPYIKIISPTHLRDKFSEILRDYLKDI